ncbi:hypothetical protein ACEU07_20910 [Chromobacterium violaceum]|uniref:hypothetical protein n=1 Tax=Chromobacterium violaceum TaxID=536 RepID=UPI0035A603A5
MSTEQWRKLVTPGHVWVARLNTFTWIGAVVLGLFALSLVRDIYGNTVGLAKRLQEVNQAEPTTWERLKAAPWDTLKGMASGDTGGGRVRPVIDMNALGSIMALPAPGQTLDVANLAKPADLKGYVDAQIVSLNKTGKLSSDFPACEPMADLRKPWVSPKTGKPDAILCNMAKSGDTIWMASFVSNGDPYYPAPRAWFGVFHKDSAGKWAYLNTQIINAASAQLPGYKSVNLDMIPFQFAADFPYLVAKQESTHE